MTRTMFDCIGNTPLVRLETGNAPGHAFAKLELANPFGMKDRVAKQAIVEAKRRGALRDGAPIVESSSGTMALGIALVAASLGHPVHIVSDPKGMDPITTAKLKALGCHLHVVERMGKGGWQGARLERLQELLAQYPDAFWPRQYDNPDNPAAYTALAQELLAELGGVDVLAGPVGSGGSLCGTARELRKTCPDLRVVAVDAVGSVIFGQPDSLDRRQRGLGNSIIPPNVDFSQIDEVHWLNDREAFTATLELAREQQIFAGNSSGSCYAVLRYLSRQAAPGARIVGIFPDRGDRYVGTVYDPEYWRAHGIDALPVAAEPAEVPYGTPVQTWSRAHLPSERSR
ncbi:MAG TPA: cysteine synthase family protein [Symbiobacteriaceae bacterium]|nr:cysteine synthase family protein [Symbiobacteriaceae bacterium]